MALLVILLPAQPAGGTAPDPAQPLAWLLSPDGLAIARQGRGAPAELPRADTVVAVLPDGEAAWHRPTMPKAPANRLRAALAGLLEEQLLAEDDEVHLALAPRHHAGQPVWVAALHKPALQARLAALASAGVAVDRLVPALAPLLDAQGGAPAEGSAVPQAHFFTDDGAPADADTADGEPAGLRLALADADGAVCLPLAGGLARALQARWSARGAEYSATPAAAAAAERWLGAPVAVRADTERALAAARTPWNLLQFDLAPQTRGRLALGRLARQLMGPAWAPARWGLAALALVQLVGLNALAWQQQRALAERRAAMDALLRSSHPQVRAVLDAPLQMAKETAALRVAAGVPGPDDFEPLLAAAAAAWPDGQPPAAQLRFEPGRLSLAAAGWAPAQVDALRQRLGAGGWTAELADGRLTIRPAGSATGPDPRGAPAAPR